MPLYVVVVYETKSYLELFSKVCLGFKKTFSSVRHNKRDDVHTGGVAIECLTESHCSWETPSQGSGFSISSSQTDTLLRLKGQLVSNNYFKAPFLASSILTYLFVAKELATAALLSGKFTNGRLVL